MNPVLELKNLTKVYKMPGGGTFEALKGISAKFYPGELVAIVGESGSGKSTLMNAIGGLDSDFGGEIIYQGKNLAEYTSQELVNYHKKSIGFIFQNYNLIPHLNLLDNVALAMTLSNVDKKTREQRAKQLLEEVGLGEHIYKKPDQISGGQKQRVSIARALINDPDVIIADEPTGALDAQTTDVVLDMIKKIAQEGKLVLMVTHSDKVASHCNHVLRIDDGRLISNEVTQQLDSVAREMPKTHIRIKNMSFFKATRLAALNMKAKLGRNTLVALGSAIGIMSVVLMLGLGKGVTSYIKSTMTNYTNPYVTEVRKGNGLNQPKNMSQADIAKQRQENTNAMTGLSKQSQFSNKDISKLSKIKYVNSVQSGFSTISIGSNQVQYNGKTASIMMLQTYSDSITKSDIKQGTRPSNNEIMLDKSTADTLGKHMVGKDVQLQIVLGGKSITKTMKISGLYEASSSTGSSNLVILDYDTLKQLLSDNGQTLHPNVVYLHTNNRKHTSYIKDQVKKLGYTGSMQEAITEMFTTMLNLISYVLTAIAAVSLVVSAIMILVVLNISVVERTKEIGVLKALGARRKDVSRIFTSEAFLLGLFAGIIGDVATYILGFIINNFTKSAFDTVVVSITPQMALSGILVAVIISMIAGLLPSRRASKLDPVDALRKE